MSEDSRETPALFHVPLPHLELLLEGQNVFLTALFLPQRKHFWQSNEAHAGGNDLTTCTHTHTHAQCNLYRGTGTERNSRYRGDRKRGGYRTDAAPPPPHWSSGRHGNLLLCESALCLHVYPAPHTHTHLKDFTKQEANALWKNKTIILPGTWCKETKLTVNFFGISNLHFPAVQSSKCVMLGDTWMSVI